MISVAMATYNGEKYILDQLLSILNQTHQPDEVVICDDKSTDKTVVLIENFINQNNLNGKWKIYKNSESLGFIKNFLNAICLTNGDFVFLSDQDDIFLPNKFEIMLNYFNQYHDCMVLNANYSMIDENSNEISNYRIHSPRRNKKIKKINFKTYLFHSNYPGFSMGFRKEVIEKIKKLNLETIYGHDILINMIGLDMFGCYEINDVLSQYRIHCNNTSSAGEITSNFSVNSRIIQKVRELKEYDDLLSFISMNNLYFDKKVVINRKNELKKRIQYLEQKNILKQFFLLLVTKSYPKTTILGDILYTLKGVKR